MAGVAFVQAKATLAVFGGGKSLGPPTHAADNPGRGGLCTGAGERIDYSEKVAAPKYIASRNSYSHLFPLVFMP